MFVYYFHHAILSTCSVCLQIPPMDQHLLFLSFAHVRVWGALCPTPGVHGSLICSPTMWRGNLGHTSGYGLLVSGFSSALHSNLEHRWQPFAWRQRGDAKRVSVLIGGACATRHHAGGPMGGVWRQFLPCFSAYPLWPADGHHN